MWYGLLYGFSYLFYYLYFFQAGLYVCQVYFLKKGWPSTLSCFIAVWQKTWHAAHDAHHDGALIMMQYAAMMSASSGAGILVLASWCFHTSHVNFFVALLRSVCPLLP
jgi:hypothetical protein